MKKRKKKKKKYWLDAIAIALVKPVLFLSQLFLETMTIHNFELKKSSLCTFWVYYT